MAFRRHATFSKFAWVGRGRGAASVVAAAVVLGGCGSLAPDGVASFSADPARYEGYHCKDLVAQWNGLIAREKQLRNLIDKASEGGGHGHRDRRLPQ